MSYMGLVTRLKPNVLSKPVESLQKHTRAFVEHAVVFVGCPECQGTPLAQYARESYLNGVSIAEVCDMELADAHLTLICVEHHRAVLAHADHIIDLGPGAGSASGEVVAACPPREFLDKDALTARYLAQVL